MLPMPIVNSAFSSIMYLNQVISGSTPREETHLGGHEWQGYTGGLREARERGEPYIS